jgi:hypothetical protein
MSASIEELTASAQMLARVSEQLRAHSSRFVVSKAPTPIRRAA